MRLDQGSKWLYPRHECRISNRAGCKQPSIDRWERIKQSNRLNQCRLRFQECLVCRLNDTNGGLSLADKRRRMLPAKPREADDALPKTTHRTHGQVSKAQCPLAYR